MAELLITGLVCRVLIFAYEFRASKTDARSASALKEINDCSKKLAHRHELKRASTQNIRGA